MLPELTASLQMCPDLTAPLLNSYQAMTPEAIFPLIIISSAKSSETIVPEAIRFVVIAPEAI